MCLFPNKPDLKCKTNSATPFVVISCMLSPAELDLVEDDSDDYEDPDLFLQKMNTTDRVRGCSVYVNVVFCILPLLLIQHE